MTRQPDRPKIYHITHVDNLAPIVANGNLVCDRVILARGGPAQTIGMSGIKRRRIEELDVDRHPGTKVGDYVSFYFCPRSIMLFVIHCANHPELAYRGGQEPIVHLEADPYEVIRWADADGRRWAFSLSNAGARYAEFRSRRWQSAVGSPRPTTEAPSGQIPMTTSRDVRERLVEALQIDLVGPGAGHALSDERLPGSVRPSTWYLTGFLIPIRHSAGEERRCRRGRRLRAGPRLCGARRGVERGAQGREEGLLPVVDGR